MDISQKIEAIRQQPENVRMKYVWGCVAVSMIIILAVWIFSIAAMFQNSSQQGTSSLTDIKQQLQNVAGSAPSLKDFGNQSLPAANESTPTQQSIEGLQAPAAPTDSTIPQSNNYSNLPNTNQQY